MLALTASGATQDFALTKETPISDPMSQASNFKVIRDNGVGCPAILKATSDTFETNFESTDRPKTM